MTKPSDFFIGIVDFFAILLPGAALAYLLQPLMVTGIPKVWLPGTLTEGWVMFFVLAYIAGHLLHALGSSLLDKYVYGKFYLPRFRSSHVQAAKLADDPSAFRKNEDAEKTLLARVRLTTKANSKGTSYYDWCLSDVRLSSPAGAVEVDRLQADSKFFRSLVFVFLLAAAVSFRGAPVWVPAVAVALTVFSIWRFCDLRWSATKRVYEYYLLSHRTQETGSAAGPS
jgi:hypothetical protein